MKRSAANLKSKASTKEQRRPIVDVEGIFKNLAQQQKQKMENKEADGQLSLNKSTHNDGRKGERLPMTPDESFEAIERMCNEMVSDPNSTLFRFVNADRKDQMSAAAKNTQPGTSEDDDILKKLRDCTIWDDVEAQSEMHTKSYHLKKSPSQKLTGGVCSSTPLCDGDKVEWQPISDESFESYERMYNKIISDPNSSLYRYVDNDEREQILAAAKNLNTSTSQDAKLEETGDECNMEFSDTMEELEYIIKKVLEGMQVDTRSNSENVVQKNTAAASSLNQSPKKRRSGTPKETPSPFKVPFEKKTTTDTLTVKPFPKLNLFAKQEKEKDASKKQFEHIVSPVGTYMKKTATTPLITNIKSRPINKDLPTPSPFRNLDNESPSKPSTSHKSTKCKTQKKLPKKAYISSDVKRIVDERTPVTIPGGQKIHKYLENAGIPAVLKHEGQVKLKKGSNKKLAPKDLGSSTGVLPRDNSSIAQLSVITGDLSLYTAVDAQKF